MSFIVSPPKPLALHVHIFCFITSTPTTRHFAFLVAFPTPPQPCPHKLVPRSSACIFPRYSSHHKGYPCMDLATHCIIISRHVDESTFPFTSPQLSSAATYKFLGDNVLPLIIPRQRLPRTPPRCCPSLRIACAAPPAYPSHPVSGLTCMLLLTGTHRFQHPGVLLGVLTSSML
jgi:hypothetical protein